MVTINLKVSMCREIIANSNITKSYVFNPYDSCITDVYTTLNAIHVQSCMYIVYYVLRFECTCIVRRRHTIKQLRNDTRLVNDIIIPVAHAHTLSN